MPYDWEQYGATDLGVIGGPSGDDYEGDSLEDFYDFLMKPRHQKRWSGSGGIKHFGPDRYASINPEDAAMADIIMKQMEQEKAFAAGEKARQSDLARRQAQDELLMPSGKGGGTISFKGEKMETGGFAGPRGTKWGVPEAELQVGGGMPTGAPEAPPALSDQESILLGVPEVAEHRAGSKAYAERLLTNAAAGSGGQATLYQKANALQDVTEAEGELVQQAGMSERFQGMSGDEILDLVAQDPTADDIRFIHASLAKYAAAKQKLETLGGGEPVEDWR